MLMMRLAALPRLLALFRAAAPADAGPAGGADLQGQRPGPNERTPEQRMTARFPQKVLAISSAFWSTMMTTASRCGDGAKGMALAPWPATTGSLLDIPRKDVPPTWDPAEGSWMTETISSVSPSAGADKSGDVIFRDPLRQEAQPMKMHPLIIRIVHWTNAVAMTIMIMSGWKIYNDEVLFGFLRFPEQIVLGVWAQHALQWHFAFMWVLTINGLVYLAYGLISGRFRRLLWPIHPREVLVEVIQALTLRLRHADLTCYNAVQRLLYVAVILVIVVQVISGLALWKPVQFSSLVALFYDFQGARLAHFLGMVAICMFMVVHVTLALVVPRTILAMLTGGPRVGGTPAASPAH
jgi:thiosulfate reductase cytochrome b subunit